MKIPFRLERRHDTEPARAVLLPDAGAAEALGLCARQRLDPADRIFAVADGLLVTLDEPTEAVIPRAIRLRALAEGLLLPVDADLIPALLEDEARGLVRDRGLVFLPGGRVLGFDPRRPLVASQLLTVPRLPSRDWEPLPERPRFAERIEEFEIDLPDVGPDDVLESGGAAIGTEDPRPGASGLSARALGGATLSAGRSMMWLGQTLGLSGLSDLGARWIQGAMGIAPRLSEAVFGRQTAALRELLREFREGDPEKALRHALPLGDPGAQRGGSLDTSDQLPQHDTSYSLGNLLGPGGAGPPGFWVGGQDLVAELTREYRKWADQAARQGDFRRAAFIHGRLLHDYRAAALVLQRGGLHRDAAILFLYRLDDQRSAARAFEAAGEHDRALKLYRTLGDHLEAGDLLRRMGEDDAATAEYLLAAERLATQPGGNLRAGDLMATRAERSDLALSYFRAGWALRPAANDLGCALRLAQLRTARGEFPKLLALIAEADAHLGAPGHDPAAAEFYNQIVVLARQSPDDVADEIRDRARMGLAAKLRQAVRSGSRPATMISTLYGHSGEWKPGLIADADLAARAEVARLGREPKAPPLPARVRVGQGFVTAVTSAPGRGDLFLGFDNGEVYGFRALSGEILRLGGADLPVASLSTNHDGDHLLAVRAGRSRSGRTHRGRLDCYSRGDDGHYEGGPGFVIDDLAEPWLTPVLEIGTPSRVGLWDGQALYLFEVPSLAEWGCLSSFDAPLKPNSGFLIPPTRAEEFDRIGVLWHDGLHWTIRYLMEPLPHPNQGPRWRPSVALDSSIRSVPVAGLWADQDRLELAGVDESGALNWSSLAADQGVQVLASNVMTAPAGYLSAALIRPGLVAGLGHDRVDWLRCGAERFTNLSATMLTLPSAVACVACRATRELLVVCRDGLVVRVAIPVA